MQPRDKTKESILYMVTNQINGDRYIGVTCGYLSSRQSQHFWQAEKKNSQAHFHRAIRKYGRDNFKFKTIECWPTFDQAIAAEVTLIELFKPEYNMTKGGDGSSGYKMPRHIVERLAAERKGRPGYWKGKKLLPHVANGFYERSQRQENKEAWKGFSKLGPKSIQRAVVCLDDGRRFDSARLAAKFYGVDASLMSSVCRRGRHKTAKGLVFRFCDDLSVGGKEEADVTRVAVLLNRQRTAAIARSARL